MAKNTGKRRRHRNRPIRKLKAKWARMAEAMAAPLRRRWGYAEVAQRTFIVEPLFPDPALSVGVPDQPPPRLKGPSPSDFSTMEILTEEELAAERITPEVDLRASSRWGNK